MELYNEDCIEAEEQLTSTYNKLQNNLRFWKVFDKMS